MNPDITIKTESAEPAARMSMDDIIRTLDNNRSRIRNLGGMILTVSGMLLSSSFVVLFFLLKERSDALPRLVVTSLFAAVAALISAITFSLLSALLAEPGAITTKLEFIDVQTRIGLREFRRVRLAAWSLLLAIALFVIGLLRFARTEFR